MSRAGSYPTAYRSGSAGYSNPVGGFQPGGGAQYRPANDNARGSVDRSLQGQFAAKMAARTASLLFRRLNPWVNAAMLLWDLYEWQQSTLITEGWEGSLDCGQPPERGPFPGVPMPSCGIVGFNKSDEGNYGWTDRLEGGVVVRDWYARYIKKDLENATNISGPVARNYIMRGVAPSFVPAAPLTVASPYVEPVLPYPHDAPRYFPAADPHVVPPGYPVPEPSPLPVPLVPGRVQNPDRVEQSEFGYGPRTQGMVNPGPRRRDERRPPRRREKEKKLVAQTNILRFISKLYTGFTEAQDAIDAVYDAIDKKRKKLLEKEWRALHAEHTRLPGGKIKTRTPSRRPQDKLQEIYENWDAVDGVEAIRNLLKNELQDRAIGAAQGAGTRAHDKITKATTGTRRGISTNPALSGGW